MSFLAELVAAIVITAGVLSVITIGGAIAHRVAELLKIRIHEDDE